MIKYMLKWFFNLIKYAICFGDALSSNGIGINTCSSMMSLMQLSVCLGKKEIIPVSSRRLQGEFLSSVTFLVGFGYATLCLHYLDAWSTRLLWDEHTSGNGFGRALGFDDIGQQIAFCLHFQYCYLRTLPNRETWTQQKKEGFGVSGCLREVFYCHDDNCLWARQFVVFLFPCITVHDGPWDAYVQCKLSDFDEQTDMTLPALEALVLERLGKDGDAADVAVSKPKHQVLWTNLYCPLFSWCSNAYTSVCPNILKFILYSHVSKQKFEACFLSCKCGLWMFGVAFYQRTLWSQASNKEVRERCLIVFFN